MWEKHTMRMNLANQITVSRLFLAGVFFGIISLFDASAGQPQGRLLVWALCVYVLACITDIVDGEIARRHSGITTFGRVIDPFVDKVLVVGTYVFFASNHFALEGKSITGVQAWMVVIILIRELLVTDLRMISESQGTQFAANFYGKMKMAVQSAAIGWILLSLVIGGATITGYWYYSRLGAALLAVLVTVMSLVAYLRRASFLLAER
jgi:CDP-diacylglycerol---glycerol-3-phosphate 3-phosphatidyltransferase